MGYYVSTSDPNWKVQEDIARRLYDVSSIAWRYVPDESVQIQDAYKLQLSSDERERRGIDPVWPTAIVPASVPIPVPVPAAPAPPPAPSQGPSPVLSFSAALMRVAVPPSVVEISDDASPFAFIPPALKYVSAAPQGGPMLAGVRGMTPIALKLLNEAIKKHPIGSLITAASIMGTLYQLLGGRSPKNYLEDLGLSEIHAQLGEDFIQFMDMAVQEGMLGFPEVPRGYDKEAFYEGLNYLHINMRTGRMWLTDMVRAPRQRRWRD